MADTIIDIYCHIYPDRFFQEMTQGGAEAGATSASGCAASPSCSISTPASRKWTSSAITGRSSRCPIRRSRISPSRTWGCKLARIANDSMARAVPQTSGALSGLRRGAVHDRRRGLGRRGAPRHQGSRRARRAALHQCRRPAARRSRSSSRSSPPWPSSICRSGCIRSARRRCRIIRPRKNRATRCGGASTGRMKPRSPWCAWCSTGCSTAIRS